MAVTLHDKSKENMELLQVCIRRERNYNAVAGRAYYAVFQRVKHLLEIERFDYHGFLLRSRPGDRPYSHGTIVPAFMDHLKSTRKRIVVGDMQKLMSIDELYNVRRKSDYDSGYEVSKPKLEWCFSTASDILSAIERLDRGDVA
jgi:uncharacterized protein (UPF0332 family)